MGQQGIGANRESARDLNCIGQFQLQASSNPCCAFGNVNGQFDYLPRLHDTAVTLREHLLPHAQRASQNFGHCNRCHREDNLASRLPIEYRSESCREPRMVFEKVDDRRAVYQDQRARGQCSAVYRLHSSRNRRNRRRTLAPHSPFPEPSNSISPFCRGRPPIGTRAAMERPRRVIIVVRPCTASSSNEGS
jgi:hypothetical protein